MHLVDSAVEGRLTATRVRDAVRVDPRLISVFLCGPIPMVDTLTRDLRDAGVAARNMHREHFD